VVTSDYITPVMNSDPNGYFIVGVMIASIAVSMLFEVIEDFVEDGEMNHSFGQYAGAFISGVCGGLSGGFGALVGYSFLGGTLDYLIAGDFNQETFLTDIIVIGASSIISISLGGLSKKGLSSLKANAIPFAIESPCPSEPVHTSIPGVHFISG